MSYTVLVGKIGLHKQTSVFQLQKYQNTLFQVFFVSKQTVRNVVALTDFHLICATRWKNVAIHKYLCICLCLVSIKGKLVLVLKTNASLRYNASLSESGKFYCQWTVVLFLFKLNQFSLETRLTCPLLRPK